MIAVPAPSEQVLVRSQLTVKELPSLYEILLDSVSLGAYFIAGRFFLTFHVFQETANCGAGGKIMGKINWGRMFLGGLLTGGLWFGLLLLIMAFVGRDFGMAVVAAAQRNPTPGVLPRWLPNPVILITLNLVIGIWTMWLYAAIRPRYGPGPKTAAVAGFALWVIGPAAGSAFWGLSGIIPPMTMVAPIAASLPAIVLAAVVGARYYQE